MKIIISRLAYTSILVTLPMPNSLKYKSLSVLKPAILSRERN